VTRLLCFGDLHLGAGADYGAEPGDRLCDQQDVLAMIVQIANENAVDAVLFAGDMFDGPAERITPQMYAIAQEQLGELKVQGIPFVGITGNGRHDAAMRDVKAPEVLRGIGHISTRPEVIHIVDGEVCPAYVPGGFSIATLPWTPVGLLVAARDGGDRDQLHEEAAAMLVAAARGLRAEIPAETPAVLLAHWSISGASAPTGAITDDFREVVLDADELNTLGFDAVVAGHIHKAADFNGALGWMDVSAPRSGSPFFYTGSPLPVDFGEAKTPHGCWLLDVGGEVPDARFVPIESRRFVTVDIDLTTDRHEEIGVDETDAVAAAIATHMPLDDAVVKIRYRATEEQARRIDWPKLRTLLDGCHKVFAITGDIVRSERARVDGMDEDIAPLVAVEAWCDANEIPDRAPLADLSARYLQEVGA
jgi:DNA repair exonuclease SbcCD nuclease subunit